VAFTLCDFFAGFETRMVNQTLSADLTSLALAAVAVQSVLSVEGTAKFILVSFSVLLLGPSAPGFDGAAP
jgi:hypothetical protein